MFGFPSGFVNGNHFGGLFEGEVVLRLSEADRNILIEQHGAQQFAPMGRPMTCHQLVPLPIVEDREQLRAWLARALDYGVSLPLTQPKPAKAKSASKADKPRSTKR